MAKPRSGPRRVSSEGSGATLEQILADPDTPFLKTDTPVTAYEWLKIVLCVPTLVWRFILIFVCLPPVWLYLVVLTWKMPLNEPLPRWRAVLLLPVLRFWGRVLLLLNFFCWPVLKDKDNLEKAKELRALMIFNHVSYLDALIIGTLFSPCGLAKAGVADIPFFGTIAKAFQFLFVQRVGTGDPAVEGNKARVGSTQAIHARAADPRYPLFAMGPEGTTKHSNYLLQFSTGAFVGGRPVVPVLLKYRCRHFNVGWGVIQNVLWHYLRMQSQFANFCEVIVLPPYVPSKEEKSDPRLYADNVRKLMAEELGVKLSPYGLPEQQMIKREGFSVDWPGRSIVQKQPDGSFRKYDVKDGWKKAE